MKNSALLIALLAAIFSQAQNVGINTNSPASTLTINGNNPDIGIMNNGLAHGSIRASGNDMLITTASDNPVGRLILGTKDNHHLSIDIQGRLSMGTTSSLDALVKLGGTSPSLALLYQNVQKGFFGLNGNDIRIGTYNGNGGDIVFSPKSVDKIWIDEDGRMSIGTSSFSSLFTLNATDPMFQLKNDDVDKGFIQLSGNNLRIGTNASNTFGSFVVRTTGSDRMYVNYKGQMGLNVIPDDTRTALSIGQDENGNSGVELVYANSRRGMFSFNGTNTFLTSSSGGLYLYRNSSYPLVCHADGNFSIGGNTIANGYRLSVHGKAIATEFMVTPINAWPDYVFEAGYPLKSIAELKSYIAQNGHLPGIPSAATVAKDGIALGDMTKQLTEKVEELSLYIIQLKEELDALKNKIGSGEKND
jgi:hypothetical protein